ncbi:hypothetical protein A1G_00350 [Rickettsia rickettsii str. 'Sheila Smith']|uniref:Uncharacterized protein n=1 Tax=Rickettsia rickettsii (strain Sheila Smith) TaxID=392021 RepID=A0A0H3AVN4_RICRS|nr:hypothetical protein A1G_00350 [Rickettsia rickettsii str. 'Sheila Smith']
MALTAKTNKIAENCRQKKVDKR